MLTKVSRVFGEFWGLFLKYFGYFFATLGAIVATFWATFGIIKTIVIPISGHTALLHPTYLPTSLKVN